MGVPPMASKIFAFAPFIMFSSPLFFIKLL